MDKLKIQDRHFIDSEGRCCLLSGMNFVCKDAASNYTGPYDKSVFQWMYQQGHNFIRLGIIWDGVEPEPGKYHSSYLHQLAHIVELAKEYHIYVMLDMHQDLYSSLYADGAPAWATMADGLPHPQTDLWSDAYLSSPAVQRAADHFWENAPAPDGIGLQDHYAAMWAYAVSQIGNQENIIGYDLMNEPFPGSAAIKILSDGSAGLPDGDRDSLIQALSDPEIHLRAAKQAEGAAREFEQGPLTRLYTLAARQLEQAGADAALVLEPSYFSNIGVESGISPLSCWNHGQVYSPHGYDLVVDTDKQDLYNIHRVERIFAAHQRTAQRLGVPVIVGEWGGFYHHPMERQQWDIIRILERNLWNHTYWCWYPGCEDQPCTKALCRGYPQATAGKLLSYSYQPNDGSFQMEYIPDGGETLVYHPYGIKINCSNIQADSSNLDVDLSGADQGRFLIRIPCSSKPCKVTIKPGN